jgi:hypothetical protein
VSADACVSVVTGAPRSGTSLVMQMLAAGGMPVCTDAARPADADNPRGYFELAAVKRTRIDASWVAGAAGRAVKVVHALVPWLPPRGAYRFVDVRRDWAEVLASQRCLLERAGTPVDACDDARLAALFEAQREAALRWVRRSVAAPLLRLEHADLLADPARAAARLNAFCGGGLDAAAMTGAVDPRLHRQRAGRTPAAPSVS